VHAVQMADGRVPLHCILAPAEWSFYPGGAATRGLARIAEPGGEDGAGLSRLSVMAVDSCVGCDVRVH